jgi:hypothetical protein
LSTFRAGSAKVVVRDDNILVCLVARLDHTLGRAPACDEIVE